MIRQQIYKLSRRLYSDSRFKERLPVVKSSNKRVSRILKQRIDNQAAPRVEPSPTQFEPFPFAITEENKHFEIRRAIEPLFSVPYEEQLSSKEQFCRNSLRHLAQQLYKTGTPVRLDVRRLPCQVNPIVRSATISEYRTSDEFSIWRGLDGKTPTVGFFVFPISKHGDTVCVEPTECITLRKETIKLCSILQDFIKYQAKSICYSLGVEGGWRRFMVKINKKGELMLIGILNPVNLRVREVVEERDNFRDFVRTKCKEADLSLVSLYCQLCPSHSCSHKDVPFELLYGEKVLHDTMGKYEFVISPETILPTNSHAFQEAIVQTMTDAFELNQSNKAPLVIDAKCGAGVLAMSLSDLAQKVVGVDIRTQAVEDAVFNVKLNKINNCEFICSSLEIVLERILEKYASKSSETIVVCDASKRGLHQFPIQAIRDCNRVKKIIYITPKLDAEGVLKNFMTLCAKGKSRSLPPFAPVLATPVDIYPHTEQCQLVVALERLDP